LKRFLHAFTSSLNYLSKAKLYSQLDICFVEGHSQKIGKTNNF